MKNEADYKRWVVKEFKDRGHYARRIEDRFSVGFPDLLIMMRDSPMFVVEAKIIRTNLHFEPSPRQFVELQRLAISPKHVVPCVLGFIDDVSFLHPYAKRCVLKDCTVQRDGETLPDMFKRYLYERVENVQ